MLRHHATPRLRRVPKNAFASKHLAVESSTASCPTRVVRLIESSGGGESWKGKKFLISDFLRDFAYDDDDRWGELSLMAPPPNYILSSGFLIAFLLRRLFFLKAQQFRSNFPINHLHHRLRRCDNSAISATKTFETSRAGSMIPPPPARRLIKTKSQVELIICTKFLAVLARAF